MLRTFFYHADASEEREDHVLEVERHPSPIRRSVVSVTETAAWQTVYTSEPGYTVSERRSTLGP